MKFIQTSCREASAIDDRQAKAVLRHRPNAIIFEAPADRPAISLPYNKYPPNQKPLALVRTHQQMLRKVAKTSPWVASDIGVYDNIMRLWSDGHDIKLYHIDGPIELLQESVKRRWNETAEPYRRGTHFPWWVAMYLRERIMADNMMSLMPTLEKMKTILIFLQKFHWLHVEFLMQRPSKQEIFDYYFNEFDVTPSTIDKQVSALENKVLNNYWQKHSDFV